MFRRLLLAFDGSRPAQSALDVAVELALLGGGTLTVLSSVPPTPWWASTGAYVVAVSPRDVERQWDEMLAAATESVPPGVPLTRHLTRGPAGPAIVRAASTGRHDLIVMGSRGHGRVASRVPGSVSAHVLHASELPVVFVPDSRLARDREVSPRRSAHRTVATR